jgi:hypothetical protein
MSAQITLLHSTEEARIHNNNNGTMINDLMQYCFGTLRLPLSAHCSYAAALATPLNLLFAFTLSLPPSLCIPLIDSLSSLCEHRAQARSLLFDIVAL